MEKFFQIIATAIVVTVGVAICMTPQLMFLSGLENHFSHITMFGPTKPILDYDYDLFFQTHNIKKYKQLLKDYDINKNFMPKLNDLGNYDNLVFTSNTETIIVFENTSYVLSLKYNKKEYSRQKQKIDKLYIFEEKPITFDDLDDVKYKIPIDFTMKDGTHYRYVKLNEDDFTGIPEEIMLIGENDKTHKIYYIFFYDQDLDFYESNEDLFDLIGPFK